ncbi:MAG TPA: TonB-dependent receptor [Thermoanaerobaculaceae bacterium]|nr:TonB-dependent receptor [Thermoanaerobaculaceae bacterium]
MRDRSKLKAKGVAAVVALVVLLLAGAALAGDHDGVIRGRVTDAGNTSLTGAAVIVRPGDSTSVTDPGGVFVVTGLRPGTYTVEVVDVGFTTLTQDVQVKSGTPTLLEIKLVAEPHVAEAINVTAERVHGEVEALNVRKNALNIVNVLPVEVITSLPNANMADAIGRLPSVSLERDEGEGKYIQVRGLESRFTSVTIDGVRIPSAESDVRQIKLDGFPSDIVGSVELHKTVSADQEGDAIGGSVNMVTRSAPEGTSYTLGIQGGYNSILGGRSNSHADGTFSTRFGGDKAFGLVLSGSYDSNGRGINDIEPSPGIVTLPDGSSATVFTGMDLRDYKYERKRFGFAGGLDYRLSPTSTLYLKGLFAQFENYGDRWVTSPSPGNFLTPTLTDDTGGYSGNVQNRRPNEQTYAISAGGKDDLGAALLDYTVSFAHSRQARDNQYEAKYDGPSAAFNVDSSNGYFPVFTPLGGVNPLDPSQYTITKFEITNEDTAMRSAAAAFNISLPYDTGAVKLGVKYRDEDKTNAYNDLTYKAKVDLTLDQFPSSFSDPNYYSGRYQAGPFPSLVAITNFFFANPGDFKVQSVGDQHLANDPNNWDAKEKVAAAYAMSTTRLGQAELQVGVRVERTNSSFTANKLNVDADGNWLSTQPIAASHDYTDVLPSVSLRYEFDRNTVLRAVYGWAVGRPDYAELVPSLTQSDTLKQVSAGNPDLKPTRGINYDLLFEHYLSSIGVVSAGVFYKDLTDPIYPGSSSIVHGGIYDGYTEVKPINGPKANIYGFEVAWQQHLDFLPGPLSGLGIDTNYTHTHSKATFDPSTGRSGTAPLQRTAPDEANLGITYDRGGFSFRVAATYNSAMIFNYNYQDGADGGLKGPNGDTYLYPHTQIDAQASYTFPGGYQIVLSGLNLNNEVFGFYNGSPHWNIQREFYNRTWTIGVRLTQ